MLAKGLVAVGMLMLAFIGLVIVTAPEEPSARPPSAVSDVRLIPMLADHGRMTELMGVATPSDGMTSRMVTNPMWKNWSEDMVREQEAYQAQIDRMLGRR